MVQAITDTGGSPLDMMSVRGDGATSIAMTTTADPALAILASEATNYVSTVVSIDASRATSPLFNLLTVSGCGFVLHFCFFVFVLMSAACAGL